MALGGVWISCKEVQFSRLVASDSLRPHGLRHTSLPVHHQLLELAQTHVHQVGDAIQPSHLLSSPSPPAFNLCQHQLQEGEQHFSQRKERGFPGSSVVKNPDAGDEGSIPGSGRAPGRGNSTPLQYSRWDNPMDGGAWCAAVHGVTKSRTRLRSCMHAQSLGGGFMVRGETCLWAWIWFLRDPGKLLNLPGPHFQVC